MTATKSKRNRRVYPRVGGAINQPFVWLRYGGLWSDAEIIIYYYRAKAFPSELELEKLPTNC